MGVRREAVFLAPLRHIRDNIIFLILCQFRQMPKNTMSARTVVLALRFTRYTVNFALNAVQIQGNRRIDPLHAHSGRMQFVEIVLLTIAVRYPRQML